MFKKIKSSRFIIAISFIGVSLFHEIINHYWGKFLDKTLPDIPIIWFNWDKIISGVDMTALFYLGFGMLIAIFWDYPINKIENFLEKRKKNYLARLEILGADGFSNDETHPRICRHIT